MRYFGEQTLDFGLDIVDSVRGLDLERDSLTREGLDKNLHCGLNAFDQCLALPKYDCHFQG